MAEVLTINTKDSTIETSIGNLSYDYLVLATGTKTNYFGNKTIQKNSMPMKNVPQALNIRSLVLQNIEEADITTDKEKRLQLLNFVIAGAGPTGVELAGALAEFRKSILSVDYPSLTPQDMQVHLVEGSNRVLNAMSEHASKKAKQYLEKLGVTIHLNTLINGYDGEKVTTNNEDLFFKTKTFIWAAGVTGAPVKGLDAKAIFEKVNRYNVNEFNQIETYKTIFALGDIALMQTDKFPKGHPQVAQPAIQQGEHLAKNIKRMMDNKNLIPFSYLDKGSMATIGRNKAVVDLKKFKFAGPFAWFVWMFIHLFFLVGFRNRVVTFFNWAYNYINYDRAARLIIRPFKK